MTALIKGLPGNGTYGRYAPCGAITRPMLLHHSVGHDRVSGSICGLAVGFAAFQLINERLAVMGFWAGFSVATFLVSWRAMAVWKLK